MNLKKGWKRRNNRKINLNKRGQALIEYALLMVVFVIILTTVVYYVNQGYQGAFNNFVNIFKKPYTY